jgi:acyl transferase domain-containing protein/acyl carrier protein
MVSGTRLGTAFAPSRLDAGALERNRVEQAGDGHPSRIVVGSGRIIDHMERVLIVDPKSRVVCAPGHIGEIWVAGDSVADGYWNRPDETREIFEATLADTGEGPFLRTGDLGFFVEDELFVTGRIKDLIIIRGRNHHPQDIERTAQAAHPALRVGCGIAFSLDEDAGEQLVLVQEVTPSDDLDLDAVLLAIRRAVTESHDLHAHRVVLIAPRTLPKTSSGKLQRRACRDALVEGTLDPIAEWSDPVPTAEQPEVAASPGPPPRRDATRGASGIEHWLVRRVASILELDPAEIDPSEPFATYGLDSVQAVSLSGEVEEWFGVPVEPTLVWDHPTIRDVARLLERDSRAPVVDLLHTDDSRAGSEPATAVAIVGIACRFPGASGPEEYWALLRGGVDAVRDRPKERAPRGASGSRLHPLRGGFLERVDEFDAAYFKITPKEAKAMDPQQRLLLEVACEALEDAGVPAAELADSKTGVFVGVSSSDYAWLQLARGEVDAYFGTGSALSIAANRISYAFGLRGPSVAVDTACSSSLVAVHQACASLRNGECDVALAGGANLILTDEITQSLQGAGALSPDGRCKTFSDAANGYVRGEGVGVIVLKRIDRALADGDSIYAVIRGSAVNNDGRSNGLMAPSGRAQEDVLRTAYRQARVKPAEVDYVEAHGTGTQLGDPIEARALGAVIGAKHPADRPLRIGSVKTNIGHLEAAAGTAGLIKVALSLAHRSIPASLHCAQVSPLIPFDDLHMRVQTATKPWPETGHPARAGVSSFGFGGTNAHVVLEEAPRSPSHQNDDDVEEEELHIVPISAHSPAALRHNVDALRAWLAVKPKQLRDVAYTASVRRSHHKYRMVFATRSLEDLQSQLAEVREPTNARAFTSSPRVVFVFPGQGSQWPRMGKETMRREPVFRSALGECDEAFRCYTDWSLLAELARPESQSRLHRVDIVQPAIFALQVALARLWRSWGIEPSVVVGHSMGEIAAAHVAGALDLDDAARVICERSRLVRAASGQGAMAVVELSAAELERVVEGRERVCVAASNGPSSCILSGDPSEVGDVVKELERQSIFCRLINVDYASHSPQMDPFSVELRQRLASLTPRPGELPVLSTVTGELCDGEELDAGYWARNLREPVRFAEAVSTLARNHDVFVELSPHPALTPAIKRGLLETASTDARVVTSLRRDRPETDKLRESLGELYAAGCRVEWTRLHPAGGRVLRLPTPSWDRERHWFTSSRRAQHSDPVDHPLLQGRLDSPFLRGVVYEGELDPERHLVLREQQVGDLHVMPGSALLELVVAAAQMHFGKGSPLCLESVELPGPLVVRSGEWCQVQVHLEPPIHGIDWGFKVLGRTCSLEGEPGTWSSHAQGRLAKARSTPVDADNELVPWQLCHPSIEPSDFSLNPACVESALRRGLQTATDGAGSDDIWQVTRIGRVELPAGGLDQGPVGHRVEVSDVQSDRITLELALSDAAERAVATLDAVELVRHQPSDIMRAALGSFRDWLHSVHWHERPIAPEVSSEEPGSWLVLMDEGGVGATFRASIEAAGGTCVAVTPACDFFEHSPNRFGVRTGDEMHLATILRRYDFDHVAHLWSLNQRPTGPDTSAAEVLRGQSASCESLRSLVRACISVEASPRIWIATCGAEQVLPEDGASGVVQAPVWGFGRSLAVDQPQLWGGLIDLDPAVDPGTQGEAFHAVLACRDDEDHVAIRSGKRFVARIQQKPHRRAAEMPALKEDASYLVAGGFMGWELSVARWLADRGARHLILLGHIDTSSTAIRDLLADLEARGVDVCLEAADASDETAVRRVLASIDHDLPPLRGVFHFTATLDDERLDGRSFGGEDTKSFERTFRAAALGAWNLHRFTRDLDLFVVFSSVSGALGFKCMENHAAAKRFVDALALHRAAAGLPALSVSWGPCSDSGSKSHADDDRLRQPEMIGLGTIEVEEALETLAALIGFGDVHSLVAPFDVTAYLEYVGRGASAPPLLRSLVSAERDASIDPPPKVREQLGTMDLDERTLWIENRIRALAARVLGTHDAERIDPEQLLPELGLDSLSAMEMRDIFEREVGVRVPVRVLFERPSPRQIALRVVGLVGTEPPTAPMTVSSRSAL